MKAENKAKEISLLVVAGLLVLVSIASVWAIVQDWTSRNVVSKGVTLVDRNLTGMNEAEVRAAVADAVSTPMLRPVNISGDNKSWTLDPKGVVSVNEDSMVQQAYAPLREATLIQRLGSRLTGDPISGEVQPAFSVDTSAVTQWVQEAGVQINRKPANATRVPTKGYGIKITPEVLGASLNTTAAVEQLSKALTADAALSSASREVSLPVNVLTPKITKASFRTAIVVSIARCRIYLYKGSKLVKSYACAPGQPAWPTPTGDFVIATKQANAPWYNPHSPWSMSMPEVIPGGPGNPMGDRKIGINYPGVFMHGVPPGEYGSIGTHASHGCMRMMPSAVHDLYGRVNIGDPVFIRH